MQMRGEHYKISPIGANATMVLMKEESELFSFKCINYLFGTT